MDWNSGNNHHSWVGGYTRAQAYARLSPPQLEHIEPHLAGPLGVMFLALAECLIRKASDDSRQRQLIEKSEAQFRSRALQERISGALKAVADRVNCGSGRAAAIKGVAEHFNVSAGTLEQAIHLAAAYNKSLRRIEIDRLIQEGWPDARIADYLKCHRSTIHNHKKRITHAGQLSRPALPQPQPR